jgi:hypothetical protein
MSPTIALHPWLTATGTQWLESPEKKRVSTAGWSLYPAGKNFTAKEICMSTIHDDLIERSIQIHWPDGFDPENAGLFAHNTIVIAGSAERIWAKVIDAATWPTWYSNAGDVVVDSPFGKLGEAVAFKWNTFGLTVASTIAEYVPHERIGWYGTADQLRAYHTWLLIPRNDNSTYVVMEEIGMGHAAKNLAQTNPGHMHRGHDLWNISLKFVCES